MPKISVHIPTYNDDVEGILSDLQKQTYKDFETLVGDDSKDKKQNAHIKKLCKKYNAKYYTRPTRKGQKGGNLNNLLKHSHGKYIAVFDADVRIKKDYFLKIVPLLKKHTIIQTQWEFYNKYLISVELIRWLSFDGIETMQKITGNGILYGSGVIIKKQVLDAWTEKEVAEDFDLNLKLAKQKIRVHYEPSIICGCDAPETISSMYAQQKRWAQGVTRAFVRNPPVATVQYFQLASIIGWYIISPLAIVLIPLLVFIRFATLWEIPIMAVAMYHGLIKGVLQFPLVWNSQERNKAI